MQKTGATVKDVQAAMRHRTPDQTIRTYVKEIPESVRMAVQNLDAILALTTPGQSTVIFFGRELAEAQR
jgi:hypothetical protein